MPRVSELVLGSTLLLGAEAQPPFPGPGPTEPGDQNKHVTSWGDYEPCTAPPEGFCADYTIDSAVVLASLEGFTTSNGGTLSVGSINYYGDYWNDEVGTSTAVAEDYCDAGQPGADQTATVYTYSGVTVTTDADTYTLESEGISAADMEDYCSVVGSHTPPMIGTTFGSSYSQSFTLAPSTKSRETIDNMVGWAVDGVVIFSPYTGPGTVAPFDESLDTCIGHPAQGRYHYHGFSPCLHGESGVQTGSSIPHSKIYGWALDGFPIYGPYGYSDGNDATSTVVRVTTGYQCTVDGAACSTDSEKAQPENWAYVEDSGMLGECNGRWTKTPEFPDGMYVYVLNVQENGFPNFPGVPYCLHGTATGTVQSSAEVALVV